MDTPLVQQLALSTFTPSTMPQATLEGMFVQREQLLQSIVQDLAASVDGTKQYLMLVGARGMGKTHFVSLAYHRLKQEVSLQDKLLIAWLREEEYGVNSWLYLIIEILRSLSPEGIKTEEQIAKLAGLPITEAEYLANRVLMEVIGDKTLLIITENIDQLLYGLGDKEQWKFRAFLQETNCCSILATTPKISVDTSKKDKPFFGFFTPIHLPVFTHDDAVAMLIKIANLSGNINLVGFLETDEGKSRVRALHHLAGGNPRVYALFAQLITEDTLEALLPAVIEMLDKLTPYYQSRVESLGQSDDQQKIVMYLARETRAVTVKEITAQCFISADKTTSNALKKLKDKGYVISTQRGREVFYEISEVLMRLCLEMKNARPGELKMCVDFLRIWYRPKERQDYLEQLEADGKLKHAQYFRASLVNIESDPVFLACKKDLKQFFDDENFDAALNVWQELAAINQIGETEKQLVVDLITNKKVNEALTTIELILESETLESLYLEGLLLCESGAWKQALKTFEIIFNLNPNEYKAWGNHGNILSKLGRYEEAITSYDHVIKIKPNLEKGWLCKGRALSNLRKYEEAIINYDRAIEIKPDDDKAWSFRGYALSDLKRYEEAITSYSHAIKIKPDDDMVFNFIGFALIMLNRYQEALKNFDNAIQLNPNNYFHWHWRGNTLCHLGKYEEAFESFDRALQCNPNDNTWRWRGIAMRDLGRYKEALECFDRALQINPNDDDARNSQRSTLDILSRNSYVKGLIDFDQGNYSGALTKWQKVFKIIQQKQLNNVSNLIQGFLDEELFPKFQQLDVCEFLPQLLTIYTNAQVLPDLAVALTRNLQAIQSPTISDHTAAEWLKMWQELAKPHPELALALRMLEAGIKYKQNPQDDRVFLSLPQEMRPLLREALGLE
jgi:tetratricopeptide (TPR) repeat protein